MRLQACCARLRAHSKRRGRRGEGHGGSEVKREGRKERRAEEVKREARGESTAERDMGNSANGRRDKGETQESETADNEASHPQGPSSATEDLRDEASKNQSKRPARTSP
eukprot:6213217-Pleurochrysis_carterae.AAC.1